MKGLTVIRGARRLSVGASVLALAISAPAMAQSVDIDLPSTPLKDFNCFYDGITFPGNVASECYVDGTRTVTPVSQTRTPRDATFDVVRNTYDVTFSGNLQVDGIPTVVGTPFQYPFGGGYTDADFFFDTTLQTVNVDASYVSRSSQLVRIGDPTPPQPEDPAYVSYSSLQTTINAIDVNADGNLSTSDGGDYDFLLATADPAAIVDNGVAVSGSFQGRSGTGAIQFGTLGGTASLQQGSLFTPYDEATGAVNIGLVSPYRLNYALSAQITTQLDETGLITPTIAVTGGINMNGSRISNLGAAVEQNDAVTLAQLEAALAESGAVVGGGGDASDANGNGALAGGSGSIAEGEGAVALGLQQSAIGNGAVAIGDPNIAAGTGAIAIGADNTATGIGAVALGNMTTANGNGSVALGNGAMAMTAGSVALGGDAMALSSNSVALGAGSIADQANTVSVGATGAERRITNVAAGIAASDATTVAQLSAESDARLAADNGLQLAVNAESIARSNADLALGQRIDGQVAVTNQLTANLNTEQAARVAGDNALQTVINAESIARADADIALGQRITSQATLTSQLAANLASEQTARLAADNALSERLDAVGTRIDMIDDQIALLDDRISGSTAVATAMSGNAFLPNMSFNLTANVATYDGAHAGSLQVGALVTENIALNAGVATGFNRNGKTAARVGMTLGF
ncbi:YadA-like family protein [Aurantiacibacter zhengii]|uniref:YadA-like family protein n=1 Tax=Aurantiacibacter zhengii TaxID=2307003 RepID=UPI0011C23536|nr:YadA-like family protein [Aurantiacibacter zhengii]